MHVYALEEENERLKPSSYAGIILKGVIPLLNFMRKVYICPIHFGQRKDDEDCLFIMRFLTRVAGLGNLVSRVST